MREGRTSQQQKQHVRRPHGRGSVTKSEDVETRSEGEEKGRDGEALGILALQLWDGVGLSGPERGEWGGAGHNSCSVLGGQVGTFSSWAHGARAACPGARTK